MPNIAKSSSACQPIVESLFPSYSVHLLAGAPQAGKTALVASMLKQIRDGQSVFGFTSHPPPQIAVIAADRGWDTAAEWFKRVGWPDIPHYSFHDDPKFKWATLRSADGWFQTFLDGLAHLPALQPGALILVDPLSAFLGGNLLDYNRVYCALGELGQLCRSQKFTILGTAHASKQRGSKEHQYARPWDRIMGSVALIGCSDTMMYLETPYETQSDYWRFHWSPHLSPAGARTLRRDQHGMFCEVEAFSVEDRPLLKLLTDQGVPVVQIVERARADLGMSRATVYRQLQELADNGAIRQVERGVWAIVKPS